MKIVSHHGLAGLLALAVTAGLPAAGLPVQDGGMSAGVAMHSPDAHTLNITAADKAIINYRSFSIGADERVEFFQPSSAAVVLNRVIGAAPSSILGALVANGRVFLVNPNGVFFGLGATVDTASFVASTLGIADEDYLAGRYRFNANTGLPGAIINDGTIEVSEGGAAVLLAPAVVNNGTVRATRGRIVLASGERATLEFDGAGLIAFAVDGELRRSHVTNAGVLQAAGGEIVMTARAAAEVLESVVNNSGEVEAQRLSTAGGVIRLVSSGAIANEGELNASGGEIHFEANGAVESSGTLRAARLLERGAAFRVSGEFHVQSADLANADGAVVLGTGSYSGEIADIDDIVVEAGALLTLLDNTVLRADANGSGVGALVMHSGSAISGQGKNLALYASENSVLGQISEIGTLIVGEAAAGSSPEFEARGDIGVQTFVLQGGVFCSDALLFDFGATSDFRIEGGSFKRFAGGDGTVGTPYHVVDIYGLAGIGCALDKAYMLGADIDASGTGSWNFGLGFQPIGTAATPFTGTLDGHGHAVTNVSVARPQSDNVGLFGVASDAVISDLRIENGTIAGGQHVGVLAGAAVGCRIHDCRTSGSVAGKSRVGGLVGHSSESTRIENCSSSAVVQGLEVNWFANLGGLVGRNTGGSILESFATGAVGGGGRVLMGEVGGLVGYNGEGGVVRGCYATGNVTGGWVVGGLIGRAITNCLIEDSYATGTVVGRDTVGGLAGYLGAASTIRNGHATGEVVGEGNANGIGGLVGVSVRFCAVQDSSATGNVSGNYNVGGLIGENWWSEVSGCWATGSVTGRDYTGGLVGGLDTYDNVQPPVGAVPSSVTDSFAAGDVTGNRYSGGLVGWCDAGASIADCRAEGTVNGASYTGGLVGITRYGAAISGSTATGNVTGLQATGGLVGWHDAGGSIADCTASGNVSGDWLTGGLAGVNFAGHIVHSQAFGDVAGADTVGGFVGVNDRSASVVECAASGQVSGGQVVGGFAGMNNRDAMIARSDASGDVDADAFAGGFVGVNWQNGVVSACLATGAVSGSVQIGGFAGVNSVGAQLRDSTARGSVSGVHEIGGFVGFNELSLVSGCIATGRVEGEGVFGGFVGVDIDGQYERNVWYSFTARLSGHPAIGNRGHVIGIRDVKHPVLEFIPDRWVTYAAAVEHLPFDVALGPDDVERTRVADMIPMSTADTSGTQP